MTRRESPSGEQIARPPTIFGQLGGMAVRRCPLVYSDGGGATMRTHHNELAYSDWRAAAARVIVLWRGKVGGTYDTLARELSDNGQNISPNSLGQCLRPNGRKPRGVADLLAAIAKVIAQKLRDHRPDFDLLDFEKAIKRHIIAGEPSPLEEAPSPPSSKPSRFMAHSAALFTMDLWTPGLSSETIVREFTPMLGAQGAEQVEQLSHKAVEAISCGDFVRQREIADDAIQIGNSAPETPLLGEGLYLKGEALRLMADFEPNRNEAKRLRREAEETYGRAEVALRGDPRPIRGRARTIEVLGDLDGAMDAFEQSFAAVEVRRISPCEADYLSLAHERVRTLRHKINCLAVMHAEAPLATPEAQRRGEQIRHLIMISEPQHKEALRLFAEHRDWWMIEWFMAQVLHAKGWTSIHEEARAVKRLEWSLRLRIEMMSDVGALSAVELGNLHWWITVASLAQSAFEPEQGRALEALKISLDHGEDRRTLKTVARQFLAAGAEPWSANLPSRQKET